MAPEQCGSENLTEPIGPPADAWGLGATLFHALSGERPFPKQPDADQADESQRFPQLVQDPMPLPGHLPQELADLVGDLLDKDPARRPTCAEAIARLEPLITELPRKMTLSRRGAQAI
jgi:serine/threonine protein kinase